MRPPAISPPQVFELAELCVHGLRAYLQNPYNLIDIVAFVNLVQMANQLLRLDELSNSLCAAHAIDPTAEQHDSTAHLLPRTPAHLHPRAGALG
jgi:hypothetical protein